MDNDYIFVGYYFLGMCLLFIGYAIYNTIKLNRARKERR